MSYDHDTTLADKTLAAVTKALGDMSSVEPEEIKLTDHIEENLFLDIERHVPQLVTRLNQDLEIEVEPDVIADFIREAKQDRDKATVVEFLNMIKEEVEFN